MQNPFLNPNKIKSILAANEKIMLNLPKKKNYKKSKSKY